MMLDNYLQKWNLTNPELIAQTATSNVYTVMQDGEKVVLKLLTPIGIEDEYEGAAALQHFDGHGAVRLLNHDDGSHLLEYVDGEELAQMVYAGDDIQATEIIAETLNKIHRLDKPNPGIRTLRRWFRELLERGEADEESGKASIYVRGARLAEELLSNPQNECVIHGDIHHHNFRLHPERGWLVYDPKGIYGERTFDAANTLCNPMDSSELVTSEQRFLDVTQVLADGMNLDVKRIRQFVFAYCCLSAVWTGNEDEAADTLTIAKIAEKHI